MSIAKFKLTEPTLLFPVTSSYGVTVGPENMTSYPFVASSFSNSNASFRITVPNPSTVLSRQFLIKQPVTLTFACADQSPQSCLQDGRDSFRSYPLEKCTDTTILNINGLSITTQTKHMMRPFERYQGDEARAHAASITPNFPDMYADYTDSVGSHNSPFGNFQFQQYDGLQGRGAIPYTVVSNTGTGAVITADLYHYVKVSPLTYGGHTSYGLVNVETADLQMNYSNLQRMWSRDTSGGRTLTGLVVNLHQPTLFCQFMNAGEHTSIPRSVDYPYANMIVRSNTTGSGLGSGASTQVVSQSLQFNSVPEKLYIYVGRAESEINQNINTQVGFTDSACSIQSVDITFDNRAGILSTMNSVQLFDMCRRNGLSDSWTAFSGRTTILNSTAAGSPISVGTSGSFLELDFGKDIPLKSDTLVSSTGIYNFSISVQARNESAVPIANLELVILQVDTGILRISNGSANSFIGVVGPADAASITEVPVNNYDQPLSYGGSMFSKFGELTAKALKSPAFRECIKNVMNEALGSGVQGAGILGGGVLGGKKSLRLR